MRIACHQAAATDDVGEAVDRLRRALLDAAARGIDVVVFPECYVGGYFPNDRAATERSAFERDGPGLGRPLAEIGRSDVTLVVGIAEREGARLFNTALVIRGGEVVGRYAKARPNEAFFTPGTSFPVFRVAGSSFGVNICNDANYPEVARAVADAGATGIVMPLNNFMRRESAEAWRTRHVANLIDRATETGCWIASADVVGETAGKIGYGCTAIVDARGRVLARVPEGIEGVVRRDLP